ncbi:hypothetical protein BGZ74_006177, partial [Mortierella antarctica]
MYELYTIIAQDPRTMRGIPAAFLLTDDRTSKPLELWLSSLQQQIDVPFHYITTDDSKVEFKAIKDAFGGTVKVHLCLWHVARSWSQKARSLIRDPDTEQAQCLQAEAHQGLHKIMYESDMLTARTLIAAFRDKWSNFQAFQEYLDD